MEKYESMRKTAEIIGIRYERLRELAEENVVPYFDLSLGRGKYERRVFQPSRVLAAIRESEVSKTA